MGTQLVVRATVEELEAHRNAALKLFGEAFDLLERAREHASKSAPSEHHTGCFSESIRNVFAPLYGGHNVNQRRQRFLDELQKQIDHDVWCHLIKATDIEKLMTKRNLEDFRGQLRANPPEPTVENVTATLQTLTLDSDAMFRRGVVDTFQSLGRKFRSHDAFRVEEKIILTSAFMPENRFYSAGSWSSFHHQDDALRDIERAFYVLDGKPVPARSGGIIGAIDTARLTRSKGPFVASSDMFEATIFKNGNLHLKCLRADLLEKLNGVIAAHFGQALAHGTARTRGRRRRNQ